MTLDRRHILGALGLTASSSLLAGRPLDRRGMLGALGGLAALRLIGDDVPVPALP